MEPAKAHRTLTVVEGRQENKKVIDDFKKAAEDRGWGFSQLDGLNSDRLARFDLSDIPLDYVVYRNLTKNNYTESERLLTFLKQNHKIIINADVTGARASTSDKHFQQGLFLLDPFLKDYALPTYEAKNKLNVMSYIKGRRVHFPIVLKYRYGTTGKDITLIKDESDLEKVKDFNDLLIEQYIEPECDYRVFVMGGAAIGIMRKNGDPDHPEDFVAWSAGRSKFIEDDPDTIEILSKIACRAADVSRLEYTGVDIIRDAKTKKLYILETNYAAGWMNFTPVTKINIPDLVLDWIEDRADAREEPIEKSVKKYIDKRKKYLSKTDQKLYEDILAGKTEALKKAEKKFAGKEDKYTYNTGAIFKKLMSAYQDPSNASNTIAEIESMPLSWAGNYIGPEVGTLEEGAILSAMYLYILGKNSKV